MLLLNGLSMGLFTAPNTASIMNATPEDQRGAASGMQSSLQMTAMTLSIGSFFSLVVLGLSRRLLQALLHGLGAHGVPAAVARHAAALPPVGVLFAAFLGYDPIQTILGDAARSLATPNLQFLEGRSFFPKLIAGPFLDGMHVTFAFAAAMMAVAAAASFLREPPGARGYVATRKGSVDARSPVRRR
ncbi:MAG TPA: hypothetical protein VMF61_08550 [Candidatus Acidoferrales bacterium]|nr:hypothetical protein [Candidatus Acidoferrales bacterium]